MTALLKEQQLLPFIAETQSSVRASWMVDLEGCVAENWSNLRNLGQQARCHLSNNTTFVQADALGWLAEIPSSSIHAIVTDPPYGLIEYEDKDHKKLKSGRGGVWRIPPSFDGANRRPLPRFTVLSKEDISALKSFFSTVADSILRILVPGGHVFVASNPLLSSMTFSCFQDVGLEKRGEVIRLVQTFRGGDRPKGAEEEFPEISVMPRSGWEPWGIFRKPIEGTVAENLRKWGTGGLRRVSEDEPFKDVISCSPTRGLEKEIAPHPSLKPQRFLRKIVRAALPLGIGIIYDPFAGSTSALAAADAVGYLSIGTERDPDYFDMGCRAFQQLRNLVVKSE